VDGVDSTMFPLREACGSVVYGYILSSRAIAYCHPCASTADSIHSSTAFDVMVIQLGEEFWDSPNGKVCGLYNLLVIQLLV
jgi:hypothetical protein